jgi:hypothetical protein
VGEYKYDRFRYLAGTGQLNWLGGRFYAQLLTGYTFDATHSSDADFYAATSGGVGEVTNRSVTVDGYLKSGPVNISLVPGDSGTPITYSLVLKLATIDGNVPLAIYEDILILDETSDIIIKPDGANILGIGSWLQV